MSTSLKITLSHQVLVCSIYILMNDGLKCSSAQKINQNTPLQLLLSQKTSQFGIFALGLRFSNLLETPTGVTQVVHLSSSQITQTETRNYQRTQENSLLFTLTEVGHVKLAWFIFSACNGEKVLLRRFRVRNMSGSFMDLKLSKTNNLAQIKILVSNSNKDGDLNFIHCGKLEHNIYKWEIQVLFHFVKTIIYSIHGTSDHVALSRVNCFYPLIIVECEVLLRSWYSKNWTASTSIEVSSLWCDISTPSSP